MEDGIVPGDSGYPLKRYLLTPYNDPNSPKQEAFNKAHMRTRVTIRTNIWQMETSFSFITF